MGCDQKDDMPLPVHRNKYDDKYMLTVTLSVVFGILVMLFIAGMAVHSVISHVECEQVGSGGGW